MKVIRFTICVLGLELAIDLDYAHGMVWFVAGAGAGSCLFEEVDRSNRKSPQRLKVSSTWREPTAGPSTVNPERTTAVERPSRSTSTAAVTRGSSK